MTELTLQHGRTRTTWGYALSTWHRLRALWRQLLDRNAAALRRRREWGALCELSDATLRDLGIARCELGSIRAELDGRQAATRMRVHWHGLRC